MMSTITITQLLVPKTEYDAQWPIKEAYEDRLRVTRSGLRNLVDGVSGKSVSSVLARVKRQHFLTVPYWLRS